ncbi:cell division protein ZapD, partial [Salmonella enterica]|uniref:cell division protein ZapD n=1 Tax=Salmonella enterica TaxID=28901 RepID=UPI003CE991A8
EDLYEKFVFFLHQESPHQHHIALATIFEMLEVAGRADLKSDLLQELERQKQILLAYQSNPNVEPEMLNAILAEVDRASSALSAAQGK